MTPHLAEPPIFVVGAGRSGTTLVRSLLEAHPRLAVTPETHFLAIWGQRAAEGFEAAWAGYLASRRFAELDVSPERCRAILETSPERTAPAALAAILAAYAEARGRPRVGEKTPGHWRWAGELLEWFPGARVVVTRRDPRAVAASKLAAPWAGRAMRLHDTALRRLTRLHVLAEEARLWLRIYDEVAPRLLADPRVRLVTYEGLVADPEGETRGLCDFLDEPFEPAMLAERGGQGAPSGRGLDPVWAAWRERHHAAARGPVAAAPEKWRRALSRREVAAIEAVAGEAMERLGFALASTPAERRAARRLARAATVLGEGELAARGAARALRSRLPA